MAHTPEGDGQGEIPPRGAESQTMCPNPVSWQKLASEGSSQKISANDSRLCREQLQPQRKGKKNLFMILL